MLCTEHLFNYIWKASQREPCDEENICLMHVEKKTHRGDNTEQVRTPVDRTVCITRMLPCIFYTGKIPEEKILVPIHQVKLAHNKDIAKKKKMKKKAKRTRNAILWNIPVGIYGCILIQ